MGDNEYESLQDREEARNKAQAIRAAKLAKFHRVLNTSDGKELMADLKIAWGSGDVFSTDIAEMARMTTFLEAYRELERYQLAEELKS